MTSWVESWLTGGCGPLGHTLIAIAGDGGIASLRCTRCERSQATDGTTCMVCNNPGQVLSTLYRTIERAPVATGQLCETCAEELIVHEPVAGWYARRASAAAAGAPEDEADGAHSA